MVRRAVTPLVRRRIAALATALRPAQRAGRAGIALAAIGVVALAIGVVVGGGLAATSKGASPAAKVSGGAIVQRRDLVATDTESGTLTYANPQTVFNRLSGTITSLPSVGQVIHPGQTLYQVDGQPVVLFNGATPAYRDLSSSASDGPDILELNRDLKAMGFDPSGQITVNNSWQTGTTDAVEAWQGSVGETQTGTIALGQVVFLPGTQRIDSVNAVLGSAGGSSGAGASSGGSAGSSSAGSPTSGTTSGTSGQVAAGPEFVSLTVSQPQNATAGGATNAATGSTGSAAASPAALKAAWNAACAQDDVARLRSLQSAHPAVLGSLNPAACEGKSSGNSQILPALKALLKAETLLLKRSAASAGRTSGTSSGSASGGSASRGATSGGSAGATLGGSASRGGSAASVGASGAGGASGALSASGGSGASGAGSGSGASGAGSGSGASGAGSGSGSSSSSSGASAQAILGTTSNQLDVVVNLDATKQSEAVVGEPVTVEMPDGNVVNGTITQVSPVAQSSSSSGSGGAGGASSGSSSSSSSGSSSSSSGTPSATIPVTVALKGRIPSSGLDQAAVSVNFEQQVERGVLSVPVTALLATAGGGYAVQEVAAPHRLIPVTPGLFAAGYVQISSSQIYPGLQVTDSQG